MRLVTSFIIALACSCALSAEKTMMITTNFENLEVGVATNPAGPTGTTVINFPKGAIGAIDMRGGAVAVRESSSVDENNTWGWLDALVLSGGSTMGLEAADGVAQEIIKQRGGQVKFDTIPAVPAAIVYDFTGRKTSTYPDKELGAKAFHARQKNKVPYGQVGGGTHVSVGKWFDDLKHERAGQGAAYFEKNGVKILVISVVNAVGNILDKEGKVIRGSLNEETGERVDIVARIKDKLDSVPVKGNTTITAVITNIKFDRLELKRMATMAHTSMASVISPFHTPWDGDVLFAVSTREMDKPEKFDVANAGVIAADLLKTAVWRAVGEEE